MTVTTVLLALFMSACMAMLMVGILVDKSVDVNYEDYDYGYTKDHPESVYERMDRVNRDAFCRIIESHSEE